MMDAHRTPQTTVVISLSSCDPFQRSIVSGPCVVRGVVRTHTLLTCMLLKTGTQVYHGQKGKYNITTSGDGRLGTIDV